MNHRNKGTPARRLGAVFSLVAAMIFLSACSSTPAPPTSALNEARDAIDMAEQAGARQHAGAELDEAQQKLNQAEQFVANEQMIEAERLAREAEVVANLAVARTESAKALEINRQMERGAEALEEEMRRTGGQR